MRREKIAVAFRSAVEADTNIFSSVVPFVWILFSS